MNEQWIEASLYHAIHYRSKFLPANERDFRYPLYEYLDVMGMYETGWMIYDFDKYKNERNKYGYPK